MDYKLTFEDFKEAAKEGKFLALRCKCGNLIFPPKKICDNCLGEDFEIEEIKGEGEIKTFTVVRVSPEGFETPYTVVLVELDEGPWVIGRLEGINLDDVDMNIIGKKVKMGHKILPPDKFSGGEMITMTFSLK